MLRLSVIIYVLAATVFAGVAVTTLLTLKMLDAWQIASAALIGAVVAIPVAWLVARRIWNAMGQSRP